MRIEQRKQTERYSKQLNFLPEASLDLLLAHNPPAVTNAEFRACRNDIVRVLSGYGSVGPSGIHDHDDVETELHGVENPAFFVVDDMYNDQWRLHLVETDPVRVTEPLLAGLEEILSLHKGWGAHVAIGDAELYVFSDQIVPCGRRFWDCVSLKDIAESCKVDVDFGPQPIKWPEGYEIWHALVCGVWNFNTLPEAPDRQWTYIFGHLSRTKTINQFSYRNRVRYELHPVTRLGFVKRFLQEFAAGRERSPVGLETVSEDIGLLLRHLDEVTTNELLSHLLAAQPFSSPKAALYLWARVVHGMGEKMSRTWSADRLEEFLVQTTLNLRPEIGLLSAILGLGCLNSPRVREVAARAGQGDWSGPVRSWLASLAKGRKYPYPQDGFDPSKLH